MSRTIGPVTRRYSAWSEPWFKESWPSSIANDLPISRCISCSKDLSFSSGEDRRIAELKRAFTEFLRDLYFLNDPQLRQIVHRIEELLDELKREKKDN